MGWRYLFYTSGSLVFLMSIARVVVIRFYETPKYLLCQGKDEQVVQTFRLLSEKYNRPCNITIEQLEACGHVSTAHASSNSSVSELLVHIRGLFSTKWLGVSTSLVWFSWALIGLGYSLYYVFLPDYLASRATDTGDSSPYLIWRNYAITNLMAIPGPIIAGFMCETKIGRKYTMVLGAILTSKDTVSLSFPYELTPIRVSVVFFFAYTAVHNASQNLGFSCAISITINIYYGTLYAYTVEVMPSAHRGTGNGIAVSFNRLMGTMSAIVGTFASTSSSAPIYVCAALLGVAGVTAMLFPFETRGKRSI
jgi:hypothetical protein